MRNPTAPTNYTAGEVRRLAAARIIAQLVVMIGAAIVIRASIRELTDGVQR